MVVFDIFTYPAVIGVGTLLMVIVKVSLAAIVTGSTPSTERSFIEHI